MLLAMTDGNKKEREFQLHQITADIDRVEYTHIVGVIKKKNASVVSEGNLPQSDKQKENRSPQRL